MSEFTIRVVRGDITKIPVDAIVNAANERMLGGAGVDGAIHRMAGHELLLACEDVEQIRPGVRCPPGEARITPAFNLPARHVIHTVGPIWNGGNQNEENLLRSAYRSSMELAVLHDCKTISFPCISTGVFSFPFEEACRIALNTIYEFEGNPTLEDILLVCFSERDESIYSGILTDFM